MHAVTAASSGRSSSAISAAITSESELEASGLPTSWRKRLRVDEVAVVAKRDRAHPAVVQERLRVLPGVAARRRVARVPDRELAVEAGEAALVEHLRHETEVAHRGQAPAFRDGDSRGLLAAMLERVEAEVAEARDVTAGRADSEDAAHQATCPSSTTSSHGMSVPGVTAATTPRPSTTSTSARQPRPVGRLAQRERDAAVGDVVGEREQMRVAPHERDEAVPEPAQQDDAVAALPAVGDARDVAHEADAADDRRRRDRRAAGLVVERDVPRDDGDPERVGRLRDPFDRLRELPADLGLLGVAEVEAVGEGERLAAGAGDVERGFHHGRPAGLDRVAAAERGAVERDGDAARAVDPQHRCVEAGTPHRARADEVVVLLEHPGLRLVVDRVDGRRGRGALLLLDLVARALVGEQSGRDRADHLARRERAQVAVVGHLADHRARQLPALADSAHVVDAARARRPRPSAPATRRS